MSQYIENHLSKDEVIVLKAKKNILYLLMPFILCLIILVAAIVGQVMVNDKLSPKGRWVEKQMEACERVITQMEELYSTPEAKQEEIDSYNAENPNDTVDNWKELCDAYRDLCREEAEKMFDEDPDYCIKVLDGNIVGSRKISTLLPTILTAVIWVAFALIGLLPFVIKLLRWLSINLALTNKRVVGKIGILRVNSLDFHLDKIDHVQIKATIFGNLLHYYSLVIASVGGAGYNSGSKKDGEYFVGIANAQEFKDAATNAIEQHAEEARRAQAEEIARAMGK